MNKPELIIVLQAVAASKGVDLSWLDVDVEFEWREHQYKISQNGERYWKFDRESKEWKKSDNEHGLINMFRNVEEIKPIPPYTPAEAEQAKKDMECSAGFEWVSKDADTGLTMLWRSEPTKYLTGFAPGETDLAKSWVPPDTYPSLKPGEKERLDVIAGCGKWESSY